MRSLLHLCTKLICRSLADVRWLWLITNVLLLSAKLCKHLTSALLMDIVDQLQQIVRHLVFDLGG